MSATDRMTADLTRFVQAELSRQANPAKAVPMAKYMKTDMPYYGVQKPARAEIAREVKKRFPPQSRRDYKSIVTTLWALPHREEKYLAIQLAQMSPEYIDSASLDLYETLIRQGAWWDFVDDVAVRLVGKVFYDERAATQKLMDQWVGDEDLWIRRTAIISQIKHKEQTDHRRLFRYCKRRASESEFFIRKAIGWALRQYSYSDPDKVIGFLQANQDRLSGLSFREGAKALRRLGHDI